MRPLASSSIFFLLVSCFVALILDCHSPNEDRMVYIVHLRSGVETDQQPPTLSHFDTLKNIVDSRFWGQSLVRSYSRSFNGFAAYLTQQEREQLTNHKDVVCTFPSTTFYPQTTRSWDFIGLAENVHRNHPSVESDIIIGVIDTGIWPESDSFNDKGFTPPKKWKSACKGGKNFTCNNKLIGARFYTSDGTARDTDGHGTHTASIAVGNNVEDASFYGIAQGTARGAVPSARIAAYKVCDDQGCRSSDILAAFDDAIADGVDIITISIGTSYPLSVKEDVIAQGALHASQKGILVVQPAGNSGDEKSVSSVVPWIFSVAASSTDRGIVTKVALANGTTLTGKTVDSFSLKGNSFPLVYGNNVSRNCSADAAKACLDRCLEPSLVKGKIVLCRTFSGIDVAYRAGATGSIVELEPFGDSPTDVSLVVSAAASGLKEHDFQMLENYYNSTEGPKANILRSETARNLDAPRIASFSSKGPNIISPDILKPDIAAPGIEILAAFSPLASPSYSIDDHRSVKYSILSGTSMSGPHVAGAAAYVKSFHPKWSASAVKSALMTTARKMDSTKDPLAEFSYGTGLLDPVKAVDPGLVYETSPEDYIKMLCSLGDGTALLTKAFQGSVSCHGKTQSTPLSKDLNYPSMTSHIKTTKGEQVVTFSEKFARTVTNVGPGNSTYKVTTSSSPDYKIIVEPTILKFGALNEKKSFEVTISGKTKRKMVSAFLEWSDGVHTARSPIVLYTDYL